jgi:hypothetical protein
MRMGMRRFTRLTNAFSKKLENHGHAVALYFMHYNFCRVHKIAEGNARNGSGDSGQRLDYRRTVTACRPVILNECSSHARILVA